MPCFSASAATRAWIRLWTPLIPPPLTPLASAQLPAGSKHHPRLRKAGGSSESRPAPTRHEDTSGVGGDWCRNTPPLRHPQTAPVISTILVNPNIVSVSVFRDAGPLRPIAVPPRLHVEMEASGGARPRLFRRRRDAMRACGPVLWLGPVPREARVMRLKAGPRRRRRQRAQIPLFLG